MPFIPSKLVSIELYTCTCRAYLLINYDEDIIVSIVVRQRYTHVDYIHAHVHLRAWVRGYYIYMILQYHDVVTMLMLYSTHSQNLSILRL